MKQSTNSSDSEDTINFQDTKAYLGGKWEAQQPTHNGKRVATDGGSKRENKEEGISRREAMALGSAALLGTSGAAGWFAQKKWDLTGTEQPNNPEQPAGTGNNTTTQKTAATTEQTTQETTREQTTEEPENTKTTPEEPGGLTAEEALNDAVADYSVDVNIDQSLSKTEQVRQAALQGAQQGNVGFDKNGEYLGGDSTEKAVKAAMQKLDFEEGEVAAPQHVYQAGQAPAVILEYKDENGNRQSDLLVPFGSKTGERHIYQNWTKESGDDIFFDDRFHSSYILDSSLFEKSFEETPPEEVHNQQEIKEDFSALVYNSEEIDVGVTIGSWVAWYAAEEKIKQGKGKEVFDELTEIANEPDVSNFAFGYDEEDDQFTKEEEFSNFEYDSMNPFEHLEWPRDEQSYLEGLAADMNGAFQAIKSF